MFLFAKLPLLGAGNADVEQVISGRSVRFISVCN